MPPARSCRAGWSPGSRGRPGARRPRPRPTTRAAASRPAGRAGGLRPSARVRAAGAAGTRTRGCSPAGGGRARRRGRRRCRARPAARARPGPSRSARWAGRNSASRAPAPTTRLRSRPMGPGMGSRPGPKGGVSGSGNGRGPSPNVAHGGPPASLASPTPKLSSSHSMASAGRVGQVGREVVGPGDGLPDEDLGERTADHPRPGEVVQVGEVLVQLTLAEVDRLAVGNGPGADGGDPVVERPPGVPVDLVAALDEAGGEGKRVGRVRGDRDRGEQESGHGGSSGRISPTCS